MQEFVVGLIVALAVAYLGRKVLPAALRRRLWGRGQEDMAGYDQGCGACSACDGGTCRPAAGLARQQMGQSLASPDRL